MDRYTRLFAVPFALALPRAAMALTCGEIAAMADAGVPPAVVVATIEDAGTLFDPAALACLAAHALPPEVLAAARAQGQEAVLGPATLAAPVDPAPASSAPEPLDHALRLAQAHKPLAASLLLADLLREDAYPAERSRIAFHLATCLEALELPILAEHHLLEALRPGPPDPWFERALVRLVALSQRTGDPTALQRVVARLPEAAWPVRVHPDLAWAAGLRYAEGGEVGAALAVLAQVPEGAHHDLGARYLEGVLLARQGRLREAAQRFEAVAEAPVTAHDRAEVLRQRELQNLAVLDVARLYYGLGRYAEALHHYGLVERHAEAWPQARFEAAWARLMANDPEGSLGELMTVRSPFFATQPWQPEAEVLRAIDLYTLCDLGETNRVVGDFQARVGPDREALHAFVGEYAGHGGTPLAEEAWSAWSGPRVPDVGPEIRDTLGRDRDLVIAAARLGRIAAEKQAVQAQKARWRDAMEPVLLPLLAAEERRAQRRAGLHLLAGAAALDAKLADLLAQAEVIAFESGEAARQGYEDLAAGAPLAAAHGEEIYVYATNPRETYWPFNGEFWEDELGAYRVVGASLCR